MVCCTGGNETRDIINLDVLKALGEEVISSMFREEQP